MACGGGSEAIAARVRRVNGGAFLLGEGFVLGVVVRAVLAGVFSGGLGCYGGGSSVVQDRCILWFWGGTCSCC